MHYLRCSYSELMEMPEDYDDWAARVSQEKAAMAERRRRMNTPG